MFIEDGSMKINKAVDKIDKVVEKNMTQRDVSAPKTPNDFKQMDESKRV